MQAPESPRIVVAHAPQDAEWGERLSKALRLVVPQVEVRVWDLSRLPYDERAVEGESLDEEKIGVAGAVVVLLGSRAYAGASMARELGAILGRAERRPPAIWISIDGQAVDPALAGIAESPPYPPLSSSTGEGQDKVLHAIATHVADRLRALPRPGIQDETPPRESTTPAGDGKSSASPGSSGSSSPPAPQERTATPTPDRSRLAGFAPDTVAGRDRLDVSREALTLGMVIAHKDTSPPVSVGLFGDWGSGKSFFMAEMRSWIAKLSEESRKKDGSFCRNVVQLEFNAWHYMDSNLWASLAREVFEGLANAVADTESKEVARERLLRATQSTSDVITATEAEIREKERTLDDAQRRLGEVERSTPDAGNVAAAAFRAALELPEIEQPLRRIAKELRLDEGARSLEELKEELDRLTGVARRVRTVAVAVKRRWPGIALGLLAVLLGAGLVYVVTSRFADQISTAVTAFTTAVGAFLAVVRPIRATAANVLSRVSRWQESMEKKLEAEQRLREVEIREQVESHARELNALRDRKNVAEQRLGELRDVRAGLDKLNRTKQLVDFIRQRDASSDYRAQLGIVARASQDFRRLSQLMAAARDGSKKGAVSEGGPTLPTVDRIILYIDDLDRCPEDKVVDVLQAVHLLLAYPLFVVVVGVDPRWLLHSLEQHSLAFGRDGPGAARDAWRSTALDYLEKIFQIPYTLRPMERTGFSRLIDDLATVQAPLVPSREARRAAAAARAAADSAPGATPPSGDAAALHADPSRAAEADVTAPPPEGDPATLDLHSQALRLEEAERTWMRRLFELIPTPRAAKRFVNVYRLIRASIERDEDLRAFVAEREFVAVQILLAMVTGAPAEAAEVLGDLLAVPEAEARSKDFWAVVDAALERHPKATEWEALAARLRTIRAAPDVPRSCEPYRDWADDVARYSFYSGRILLGPQARPPGATRNAATPRPRAGNGRPRTEPAAT